MAFEKTAISSLDYMPCRYPGSKLRFRGPKRTFEGEYVVFLGGTETYGKFIAEPYPALIERAIGLKCVNLGWPNAGVDVFLNEPGLLQICCSARVVVLQVPGAPNVSNRFYSVHPRRNDRFLGPTELMKDLFPDIDFTEFHFTRHMLTRLQHHAKDRFHDIREELQRVWIARMKVLLARLGADTILFWFAPCDGSSETEGLANLTRDPALVTRQMIRCVAADAAQVVTVRPSAEACAAGVEGMVFSEFEALAAAELSGPAAHEEAAEALIPAILAQRDHGTKKARR